MKDKCMTLRQLINELTLISEEHKDKEIRSISCVGNRAKNLMSIIMYPKGGIDGKCDNKYIELDFVGH